VSGTHGYRAVIDHLKRSVGGMLGWDDDTPAPFPSSFSDVIPGHAPIETMGA